MRVISAMAAVMAFLTLAGCAVLSTAASVTGSVVSTTVEVTGDVIGGVARTVTGSKHDDDSD
jgi:ABC-type Zn uptake system ZnuABC Zn-binding protein ZnuA